MRVTIDSQFYLTWFYIGALHNEIHKHTLIIWFNDSKPRLRFKKELLQTKVATWIMIIGIISKLATHYVILIQVLSTWNS